MRCVLFAAWARFDAAEVRFWRALAEGLRRRELRLVLATSGTCPPDLGVEHVTMTSTLDALWPGGEGLHGRLDPAALGLDAEQLLARETAWSGPAIAPAMAATRREGLALLAAERLHYLQTLAPALTVIWNGQHVAELILAAASRQGGAPVLYAERAPITDALFVDDEGLSSASRVAAARPWPPPPAAWRDCAAAVSRRITEMRATWWEQPASRAGGAAALRATLGIPPDARVVLFAGQVDQDTQAFLFAPRHASNLDAFDSLLAALATEPGIYVLGKQHPKSRTPAARYRERLAASGLQGAWRDDVSIDDALAVADRVCAVNSTVLYEALAWQRPVLALGDWLLSGQGVAYEPALDGPGVVAAWLRADGFTARQERWLEAMGHLLGESVYAFDETGTRLGLHGADELAERMAARAAATGWQLPESLRAALLAPRPPACWSPADPQWASKAVRLAERIEAWHHALSLRYALLPAVEAAQHGRRVMVLGRHPSVRILGQWLRAAGAAISGPETFAPAAAGRAGAGGTAHAIVPPFVVVAERTTDAAAATQGACERIPGVEVSVVEPHLLDALQARAHHAGDAA